MWVSGARTKCQAFLGSESRDGHGHTCDNLGQEEKVYDVYFKLKSGTPDRSIPNDR